MSFKAANPDWNPTDPSGSLYLSRLADLNANSTYGAGPLPRRQGSLFAPGGSRSFTPIPNPALGLGGAGTVSGAVLSNEQRIAERAQAYDRALQKSQAVLGTMPRKTPARTRTVVKPILSEDEPDRDGEVRSELGDSYIDGMKPVSRGLDDGDMQGEIEELTNGGVMGLLTQIYDGRRQVL